MEQLLVSMQRLHQALDRAGIAYEVIGGMAAFLHVDRVDPILARLTRDIDIAIRRTDLENVKTALAAAGFTYRHAVGIDMFLDGPGAKARDAVHILFANEKVRPEYAEPAPDVAVSELGVSFRAISLAALVRMKLTSYRKKDQVHILDMIDVGLVDDSWLARVPPELADRLRQLLANPDG